MSKQIVCLEITKENGDPLIVSVDTGVEFSNAMKNIDSILTGVVDDVSDGVFETVVIVPIIMDEEDYENLPKMDEI